MENRKKSVLSEKHEGQNFHMVSGLSQRMERWQKLMTGDKGWGKRAMSLS